MSRGSSLILFVLLPFLANYTSYSQTKTPASVQTFHIDLDTEQGHASFWRYDNLGSSTTLHGTIKISAVRKDPKWMPIFMITLRQESNPSEAVRIQFAAPKKTPPLVILVGRYSASGDPVEQQVVNKTLDLDAAIDIDVDWSTQGTVTFKVGDAGTYTFKIPWKIETIEVSSSTGEMIVDPLELVGPAN